MFLGEFHSIEKVELNMNEQVKELEKNKNFENYKIIDDLKPGLKSLNIKIKCISKNQERKVVSKNNGKSSRVTEALVGDSTGCIYLTLWDDDIDKMEIDHIYKLTSVFTKVFRGSLRLNIGRFGSFEELNSEQIQEMNTKNNLSKKSYAENHKKHSGGKFGDTSFNRRKYNNHKRYDWIR